MSGIKKIPFFGLDRQYALLRDEILAVTDEVYRTGQVLDGEYTRKFEQAMAIRTQRQFAVAVNSCTQALIFALRSVDQIRSDRILIPTQSFVATLNSVMEAGLEPVFCDVNPITGLIDLSRIMVNYNEINAIMYVNLFGNIVDYDKLRTYQEIFADNGVHIIEDAAQSLGASYSGIPSGKLGDVSCLSFDPTKNLPAYGSGGMVLTDDVGVFENCLSLRDNGKYHDHTVSGTNSKISEADAAQLLVKLQYFDGWQARRREIAEYYSDQLTGYVTVPPIDARVEPAWHKFVIHSAHRTRIRKSLENAGIETRVHYSRPLNLNSIGFAYDRGLLATEGAEEFGRTCLSLPIYPELTDVEVETVVDQVRLSVDSARNS
jgi:dTDP-4-amino-4,6-dideoxygalactose transaminase